MWFLLRTQPCFWHAIPGKMQSSRPLFCFTWGHTWLCIKSCFVPPIPGKTMLLFSPAKIPSLLTGPREAVKRHKFRPSCNFTVDTLISPYLDFFFSRILYLVTAGEPLGSFLPEGDSYASGFEASMVPSIGSGQHRTVCCPLPSALEHRDCSFCTRTLRT